MHKLQLQCVTIKAYMNKISMFSLKKKTRIVIPCIHCFRKSKTRRK